MTDMQIFSQINELLIAAKGQGPVAEGPEQANGESPWYTVPLETAVNMASLLQSFV